MPFAPSRRERSRGSKERKTEWTNTRTEGICEATVRSLSIDRRSRSGAGLSIARHRLFLETTRPRARSAPNRTTTVARAAAATNVRRDIRGREASISRDGRRTVTRGSEGERQAHPEGARGHPPPSDGRPHARQRLSPGENRGRTVALQRTLHIPVATL